MEKQERFKEYEKPEERLLLAKIEDKMKQMKSRNKVECTDFLDIYQQQVVGKYLKKQKQTGYYFLGGIQEAERKCLLFYPSKLELVFATQPLNPDLYLATIRIMLPNDLIGTYLHKSYLGALMKLGIKREKVGDILVDKTGADIIVMQDMGNYIEQAVKELKRFQKAKIEQISLKEIRKPEVQMQEQQVTVSSMRLDNLVAELARVSRSKAADIIREERVFINNEKQTKQTKEVQIQDRITIRGKGRFVIKEQKKKTKQNKIVLSVEKYQ